MRGKLPRPGYLHTLGEGGKVPRVGAYPGVSLSRLKTNAERQLHSPCGEGGGASYPGFKINRYTGSVCLFVHIVAWYTRGYTYIFTS